MQAIEIDGVKYRSIREAARALGLSYWKLVDIYGGNPLAVTIRGTTYPTKKAAAKALNLHHDSVLRAAASGRLEIVGTRRRLK